MAITILPNETDPDSFINPYAVLAFPVPFEHFQSITRRQYKIYQLRSVVEHTQLPPGKRLQFLRISFDLDTKPNAGCVLRSEGTNHSIILTPSDTIVKDYYGNIVHEQDPF